ncbi:thiamine pyrophosphate-binding protein [Micromonospora sp. WMMD1120]|uniref:thiamine pyrophosphate-binding protein n=1 Tax=Micromonospora sp. WMMD1120 TaxID=3016106 RepID=UPI0024172871|nr:thiamine pyrophosphate-binding protein [Micromonospora sp. WMMD1120]MDG4808726.1 thiamine pyrophosphate-binding protein [Micromonospora sp. WMMD1120]
MSTRRSPRRRDVLSTSSHSPHAQTIIDRLAHHGVTHATGVPCSYLKGLFSLLEAGARHAAGIRYLPAPREDTALGVASGIAVGGQRPVVLMQNSGLGYSLNVLTSFNLIYDVPLLLIVSWRGCPGAGDAVEHDVIGEKLPALLDLFELPYEILAARDPAASVDRCMKLMADTCRPTVLIVPEGV